MQTRHTSEHRLPMDPTRDFSRCVTSSEGLKHPSTLRKNSADMYERIGGHSIIHSPSFTFLVGPKHTKLTIQSALAQHVSKPLHNLMNNGHTRESRHRIAVLEEEDVETFVAFCEYAYTGDYTVPQQALPRDDNRIKAEIPQSPTNTRNSWGHSQRSESFSSAVPHAPSPPPENLDSGPQVARQQIEPESEPTITEEPSAEAAAEENAETPPEASPEHGEQDPSGEPQASMTSQDEPESQPQPVAEPASPEHEAPLEAPAEEPEESGLLDEPRTLSAKEKKKARKAAMKKQRELQNLYLDEPQANPTPPSTPPLEPSIDEPQPESQSEGAPADVLAEEGTVAIEEDAPVSEQVEPKAQPEAQPTIEVQDPESEHQPAEPEAPESEPQPAEPIVESEQAPEDHDNEADSPAQNDPIEGETWEECESKRDEQNQSPEPQKPMIDMSFAKQPNASPRTPGLSLWDEFAALQYVDDGQAPITSTSGPTTSENFYPTFHAKVYVFATRYLIPALAQLCLRKLHGDLLNISFTDPESVDQDADYGFPGSISGRQVPMVLDLLRYAYFKTTRLEPISPTSATQLRENELRRLVVHFAACKVKELALYHPPGQSGAATPAVRPLDAKLQRAELATPPASLRVLLDMTPELASDLVYRMM